MRKNILQLIYEGKISVDELTDEEQERLLQDYNTVATQWAQSPKEKLRNLGKEILLMIEESGFESGDAGETLH